MLWSSDKLQSGLAHAGLENGSMSGSTQCAMHPPRAGPRQYGKRVEKLRSVCRVATITIPPSLYSRNKEEGALEAALEELLAKHGLDADSGAAAAAVLCSVAAIGPLLSCGRCSACLAVGMRWLWHALRTGNHMEQLQVHTSPQHLLHPPVPICACRRARHCAGQVQADHPARPGWHRHLQHH